MDLDENGYFSDTAANTAERVFIFWFAAAGPEAFPFCWHCSEWHAEQGRLFMVIWGCQFSADHHISQTCNYSWADGLHQAETRDLGQVCAVKRVWGNLTWNTGTSTKTWPNKKRFTMRSGTCSSTRPGIILFWIVLDLNTNPLLLCFVRPTPVSSMIGAFGFQEHLLYCKETFDSSALNRSLLKWKYKTQCQNTSGWVQVLHLKLYLSKSTEVLQRRIMLLIMMQHFTVVAPSGASGSCFLP